MCDECIICGSEQGIGEPSAEHTLPANSEAGQHNLRMCMANHLEVLALGALPWHFGETVDKSSSQAQGGDTQRSDSERPLSRNISHTSDETKSRAAVNMETIARNAASQEEHDLLSTISIWSRATDEGESEVIEATPVSSATQVVEQTSTTTLPLDGEQYTSRQVRALFAFEAKTSEQLDSGKGDIIDVMEMAEDGWWKGIRDGKVGMFPSFYVDTDQTGSASFSAPPEDPTITSTMARALYDFIPTESGELGFAKDDIIEVVELAREGWLRGKLNGSTGIFPMSYVTNLDERPAALPTASTSTSGNTTTTAQKVRALVDWTPGEPGLIALRKDDVIQVIEANGHWWKGKLRGTVGMFPSTLVEEVGTRPIQSLRMP
jgi:hypothetical protein